MVAEPAATPFTATLVLMEFPGTVTVAGTVATPMLLEFTLIVNPSAGAGADRSRKICCVTAPVMEVVPGEKLMVYPVTTV